MLSKEIFYWEYYEKEFRYNVILFMINLLIFINYKFNKNCNE